MPLKIQAARCLRERAGVSGQLHVCPAQTSAPLVQPTHATRNRASWRLYSTFRPAASELRALLSEAVGNMRVVEPTCTSDEHVSRSAGRVGGAGHLRGCAQGVQVCRRERERGSRFTKRFMRMCFPSECTRSQKTASPAAGQQRPAPSYRHQRCSCRGWDGPDTGS
jgi:hypothetical protein